MRKIIFYILVISTVLACKTNKNSVVLQSDDSTELKIGIAFIQKEIPGTEGEKEKTYLTVNFIERIGDNVNLEKLWVIGEIYTIQKTDYREEKTLKVDVTNSNFWNKSTIPEVRLYYQLVRKDVVQEINATIKEPIFLP